MSCSLPGTETNPDCGPTGDILSFHGWKESERFRLDNPSEQSMLKFCVSLGLVKRRDGDDGGIGFSDSREWTCCRLLEERKG